jgi:transposase
MEEIKRYDVIKAVLDGKMTNREASGAAGLSERQIKRLKKKVKCEGLAGVVHGNRNRPSHRAFPCRNHVIELAKKKYFDFNFTHLSETLEEREHISISRETLRQWLRPLGFGSKIRKQPRHRKRRKRSEKEGQMLFLDGSPHGWFKDEKTTLILCTDDATGKPLQGIFRAEEDLDGCFAVCEAVFRKYGLPVTFYLDRASQFTTTRHGGIHIRQSDAEPTQFERAMGELNVRLLFANSPQARGRGERINGTFQDRLTAELRLHRITDTDAATRYLNEIFIPRYAERFGVVPEDADSAWRKIPDYLDIRNVLSRRFRRKVRNDNTISVNNHAIQLLPTRTRRHFVKAEVDVHLWLDGSWHVLHRDYGNIPCKEIIDARWLAPIQSAKPASEARAHQGVTNLSCRKGDIFMLQ